MMVSDVHFPRHDPRKVELFLKVMKAWKPDAVDLLGDIDDADSTSRWAAEYPAEFSEVTFKSNLRFNVATLIM